MTRTPLAAALAAVLLLGVPATLLGASTSSTEAVQANPFFEAEWNTPFGAVPFDRIRPEHFVPAFEAGMAAHLQEIAAITGNREAPDFENTIVALERAGRSLDRVAAVFFNMSSANSNEAIRAVQMQMAPRLAAHQNRILLDPALFTRVEAVHAARAKAGLNAEQLRLVERYHLQFVRAGAALTEAQRQRVAAIGERMASLSSQFQQNLMQDTDEWALFLDASQMAGLPEAVKGAAAA